MNTDSHIELSSDELEQVTGGMDNSTRSMILNIMAGIPVIGVLTQTGRVIGNAINAYNGNPMV
jgi:hypothetical protein